MNDPTIPPSRLDGAFHRYCSPAHKLTDLPAVAGREARWHRRGEPPHLYAADSLDTMWAELGKHLPAGIDTSQVVVRVGAVHVAGLGVLDVTEPRARFTVGVSLEQLVGNDYTPCQDLADVASAQDYEGILAPSAARPSGCVLVVFAAFLSKITVVDDAVAYGVR